METAALSLIPQFRRNHPFSSHSQSGPLRYDCQGLFWTNLHRGFQTLLVTPARSYPAMEARWYLRE